MAEGDQELGREGLAAQANGDAVEPGVKMWELGDAPEGTVTYVLQQRQGDAGKNAAWIDVGRRHFPKKTQVKTVLLTLVADMAGTPTLDDRYRVLDEGAAAELGLVPRPPAMPDYQVVGG